MPFLPISHEEMINNGWNYVDFIVVTGDAYVDHPSFGTAIISRVLEDNGFKVGILSQPDFRDIKSFKIFGRPRYGIMISSGNVDSMVANYTASKKKRSDDPFSPGNKSVKRPDRAVCVYSKMMRQAFPETPIIIGGLEASLRRFAGYDYWDDCVKPSVLIESGADLLTYGMGENQTVEIAKRLSHGIKITDMTDVRGTCYVSETPVQGCFLPSFEEVKDNKKQYAKACRMELDEQDHIRGRMLVQKHGKVFLVQNPPMPPLTTRELDHVYSLPYMRYYHPYYEQFGGIDAIKEVEFSITHNRGCFGACNFCSLAFHQGRYITSRSEQSVLDEAEMLTKNPHFKGYIHDVGGPTANFRFPSCQKQKESGLCKGKKCLAPIPCDNLECDHTEYLDILRKMRKINGIKKVFIRSGIRFDYLIEDKDDTFFKELVEHHISGQLKVAPEHCSASVLDKMGKPHIEAYLKFKKKYEKLNNIMQKEQFLVPYLMSSHPGCTLNDAIDLALFIKEQKFRPQQVQDFYPTPGTISTCMFYTGIDPYTMKEVYVPKSSEDKKKQRALLQYFKPENYETVRKALIEAGRQDLIGNGKNCLVPHRKTDSKNTLNKRNQGHKDKKKCIGTKTKRLKG